MTVWWVWLALAALFAMLEVVLPVFAFLGFAVGAAITGLVLLLGAAPGTGGTLLIFAGLSAVAYGGLRLLLGRAAGEARIVERDVNDS